ncbi:MAG: DUF5011 domain-containing protein, partial [Patescibacteria group bacterium]|nr:DUF5011 domain-containing protein [Patescibacteria group bacterium]
VIGTLFADTITVNNLTVGSASQPAGITLYDQTTKAPYCISMNGGSLVQTSGACGSTTGSPQTIGGLSGSSSGGSSGGSTSTSTTSGGSTSTTTPVTVPPTITINGNNPATVAVGSTYADLGATVSDISPGQAGDTNLGIYTFVNGSPVTSITLDTSTTTTYLIDYVATDHTGLTATSTRRVNVQ